MEPAQYVPAFLEHDYLQEHPGLTDAARELLHTKILENPDAYASSVQSQALIAYARAHEKLLTELHRMEELPDDDAFEKKRAGLFDRTRLDLFKIIQTDEWCIDAQLLNTLLADVPLDSCLGDLMQIEQRAREHLQVVAPEFDLEAPHYWRDASEQKAAELTRSNPLAIGWLHTIEALSCGCVASARYRAAERYARQVMQSRGYDNRAIGTLLLAQARLEDEDGFFATVHEAGEQLEDSPWYLLGRTILFYKLGRRRNAQRALRDFATRCDGGAFFLLNPTYLTPYLPVRPTPRNSWDLSHQAVWEADGIIVDTPDFAPWAQSVEGIEDISERFARKRGF